MRLNKMCNWFFSTIFIGCLAEFLFSIIVEYSTGISLFSSIWLILFSGATLAVFSELGFFAYLTFNWLVRSLSQNDKVYNLSLFSIILVCLANLLYWKSIWVSIEVVVVATIVALIKARLTNKFAIIPTLFFMIVATIIEAMPSIHPKDVDSLPLLPVLVTTIGVLLLCNAWQILRLPKWLSRS